MITNIGHPEVKGIAGFIKLCPQYKHYYKGEVQYSYTMDFSFVC